MNGVIQNLVNGKGKESHSEQEDFRNAVKLLEKYESKDGLDVQSLLDSKQRGGLVYVYVCSYVVFQRHSILTSCR